MGVSAVPGPQKGDALVAMEDKGHQSERVIQD
jgi:hypothetical protein